MTAGQILTFSLLAIHCSCPPNIHTTIDHILYFYSAFWYTFICFQYLSGKKKFDFVCIISTSLTFYQCLCHKYNVMLWELILVIFELMTNWHIKLNTHLFKIRVRYTSFASCSKLSYSFNQKVQWCLRKIESCSMYSWNLMLNVYWFIGQWMLKIYRYINW